MRLLFVILFSIVLSANVFANESCDGKVRYVKQMYLQNEGTNIYHIYLVFADSNFKPLCPSKGYIVCWMLNCKEMGFVKAIVRETIDTNKYFISNTGEIIYDLGVHKIVGTFLPGFGCSRKAEINVSYEVNEGDHYIRKIPLVDIASKTIILE